MDDFNSKLSVHGITQLQWKNAMTSTEHVVEIKTDEAVFWLKKAAPARGIWRYRALNLFSWLLRLPLLKAVPQPGGNVAIQNSIKRIQKLASSGILVPKLIAYDDSWLLIKNAGTSIIHAMKQSDTSQAERQQLLSACLTALKTLHAQDQYLSQAFIRNMLLHDKQTMQVAFIDFEDDPLTVMSLPEAQARDLLLLVNSTARFFIEDTEFLRHSIRQFITDHDPKMVKALQSTAQRMQWITRIPMQKLFGHDYQKLKVGILAFKDI